MQTRNVAPQRITKPLGASASFFLAVIVATYLHVAMTMPERWTPSQVLLTGISNDEIIPDGRLLSGSATAATQIVAFVDPRCTTCHRELPSLMRHLAASTVALRLRYLFPEGDAVAQYAALTANASDAAGVFASYQEKALEDVPGTIRAVNSVIADTPSSSTIVDNLRHYSNEYMRKIEIDFRLANRLKLRGTPVYIICRRGEQARFASYLEISRLR
jgi:hypothetical protein